MLRALLLVLFVSQSLCAQVLPKAGTYPDKPIRFISPFPPGGGNDTSTRIVTQRLAELTGQSIIVENKGGAGGNLGAELAAKSPADGYTVFTGQVSIMAVNPTLYAIGRGAKYATSIHDVTAGAAKQACDTTSFSAQVGYDLVTSWGSPRCGLVDQLSPEVHQPALPTISVSGNNTQLESSPVELCGRWFSEPLRDASARKSRVSGRRWLMG